MPIWKFAAAALCCCLFLGGCGSFGGNEEKAAPVQERPAETAETTAMAVPDKGIPVLMYHKIGDEEDNDAVLLESHLREQMEYLKREGYHPITLDELYGYVTEGKAVPVKPVVLTFDDGYPDTYTIVMPMMKEYGFPCTVFVPTDDTDKGLRLSWPQVLEMKDAGMTIASHSYRHERLTDMDEETAAQYVSLSQERLRGQLGADNVYFCYPYGRTDDAVKALMKENGIKMAVTMNPGWAKYGDDPYAINRIWIGNAVELENFAQRIATDQYEER